MNGSLLEKLRWYEGRIGEDEMAITFGDAADDNERLRTALEWIAHRCPKVYTASDDPHRAHVEAAVDSGNCARAAITEKGDTK